MLMVAAAGVSESSLQLARLCQAGRRYRFTLGKEKTDCGLDHE